MATTVTLSVLEAPLTIEHAIAVVDATMGSPFYAWRTASALVDRADAEGREPTAAERAEADARDGRVQAWLAEVDARVRGNAACRAAIEARLGRSDRDIDFVMRSPMSQICVLAPRLTLGESFQFAEDAPVWDHASKPAIVDLELRDAILESLATADRAHGGVATAEEAAAFLDAHLGKVVLIVGE